MRNVFLLPTDQPSRLYYHSDNILRFISDNILFTTSQHIYITSSEKIKESDWVLYNNKIVRQVDKTFNKPRFDWNVLNSKKIILTTDPTLIADGVQAIDDNFLEWFVKNPTCEFVEVKKQEVILGNYDAKGLKKIYDDSYKIIIPQEEPKQETLEEAAKDSKNYTKESNGFPKMQSFIDGANYMAERMYSEEDMRKSFFQGWVTRERFDDQIPDIIYPKGLDYEEKQEYAFNLWFEQFKKK
jgi:hypothetical protein